MNKLIEKIEVITPINTQESVSSITAMISGAKSPVPLLEEDLLNALSIKGEYLVLKLNYKDFSDELKYEKIKYKISQALSVVVSYEDDGNSFSEIEQFVNYIGDLSDAKQNSIFGIKQVDKLSEFPITILFSGILAINQLKVHISSDIYELIHSDETYFQKRFQEFRETLSQEVGIPILPVFPKLDTSLQPTQAMLIDLTDEKVVSSFSTNDVMNKVTIESYLTKLFYIYISLTR